MKTTYSIITILGCTFILSNCAIVELPFKAASSVLDTTSSVIKSTTGAATKAASSAAPFFLEHTEEGAPNSEEEATKNLQTSPELETQNIEESQQPLLAEEQALVFVAN